MVRPASPFLLTRLVLVVGGLALLGTVALIWAASVSNLASRLVLRLPIPDFSGAAFPLLLAVIGCFWLWITSAALGRRKAWARTSILAIALACLALGIWLIGGTSLASLTSLSISRHLRLLYGLFIAGYASLIALGLYWLIYFNLPRARTRFLQGELA